jgi:transcription initiation factor TFIID subunit 5
MTNNISKVTDYLLKRGFNRTEEIFRQESKHLGADGKPLQQLANMGPKKYAKAFNLLYEWVENNLDIYKVGLPTGMLNVLTRLV